jgi:hypothetical protein
MKPSWGPNGPLTVFKNGPPNHYRYDIFNRERTKNISDNIGKKKETLVFKLTVIGTNHKKIIVELDCGSLAPF